MQEDDVPVLHLIRHGGNDAGDVVILPVLRIHRPEHDRAVRPGPGVVICLTVRGAQPEFSIPQDVPELGADAPHLKVEVLAGQAGHRDVVEGVDADLMALPGHAADQLLIALKAVSQQKEGGGHLPQGQLVQKAARSGRPGPVIEGEGHHRHLQLDFHLRAAGGSTVPGRLGSGGEGQRKA